MPDKILKKKCLSLSYTGSESLTEEIFISTITDFNRLLKEYDPSQVLAELSALWPVEKAIAFFEKYEYSAKKPSQIKNIASVYPNAHGGGIARVQAQIMTLWDSMGYNVVLFSEMPENVLDFPYPSSVTRLIIPDYHNISERLIILYKYISEQNVDLYINNIWAAPYVLWECVLLKLLGIPTVQYIHSDFAYPFSWGKFMLYYPQIFKLCDLVLCLSESAARFYQLCGCRAYLLNNPVPTDLAITSRNDVSELSSRHILMIGRLSIEKRPMDALRIFKKVHDELPDTKLDIVGSDNSDYKHQIEHYCKTNNIEDAVKYHGALSQDRIAEFYNSSALVLFTSEAEGYGMVLLESKAYGLPIVMYELPYLTLVKDKKGILSAPIGNISQMSEHIVELLKNDVYRAKLGQDSRESFEMFNSYDLENAWSEIIDIVSSDNTTNYSSYYDPRDISGDDKYIEPMLLDMIKLGYDHEKRKEAKNIKVGKIILFIPRKLSRILRRIFDLIL